jgi:hypothetical protein
MLVFITSAYSDLIMAMVCRCVICVLPAVNLKVDSALIRNGNKGRISRNVTVFLLELDSWTEHFVVSL